jgi:uncharacterized damage-inducible protein DinB
MDITPWRPIIWRQFGAAIDMLDDTLRACPDQLWAERLWDNSSERWDSFFPHYWYLVYHTLFWLDLYLDGAEEGFMPPPPNALIEQDDDGPVPDRLYTKAELLGYLNYCRQKCQATIEALTDEAAQRRCQFGWGEVTFAELLLYNMRHVQEHAAQLSLLLGQKGVSAPDWTSEARSGPA